MKVILLVRGLRMKAGVCKLHRDIAGASSDRHTSIPQMPSARPWPRPIIADAAGASAKARQGCPRSPHGALCAPSFSGHHRTNDPRGPR